MTVFYTQILITLALVPLATQLPALLPFEVQSSPVALPARHDPATAEPGLQSCELGVVPEGQDPMTLLKFKSIAV